MVGYSTNDDGLCDASAHFLSPWLRLICCRLCFCFLSAIKTHLTDFLSVVSFFRELLELALSETLPSNWERPSPLTRSKLSAKHGLLISQTGTESHQISTAALPTIGAFRRSAKS
uniref:Uncharacterized protein n=1 Tax=Physcomitrium patens TaxID=3218 RepID=A0A2K1IU16_PHYPA|nr:hypothetical protein PHYPA_024711 [Physcomitrium patens]